MKQLLKRLLPLPNYRSLLPPTTPVKSTPTFVLDQQTFVSRLTDLQVALKKFTFPSLVAYSFKTNYDLTTTMLLHKNKLLAEVVSSFEYSLAKKLKFADNSIIINGPNKGPLSNHLQKPVIIHLDNFSELDELAQIAPKAKIKAHIGLRLRTSLVKSRFGFNIDNGEAQKAINILQTLDIPINSVHIHLGSDIFHPSLYQQTAIAVGQFLSGNFLTPRFIDFGGGYPAHGATPYGQDVQKISSIYSYVKAISAVYDQINYTPTLIVEPGRYLIDDAVTFYSKVINTATSVSSQILTLNATINMLPSLWYRPATLSILDPDFSPKKCRQLSTTIYGSSCQEHDLLFQGKLPACQNGDIVAFHAVGAYNQSMAPDFIFPKPKTTFMRPVK